MKREAVSIASGRYSGWAGLGGELGTAPLQPGGDGGVKLVQLADEEVVGVFHDNEFVFAGQRRDEISELGDIAELVIAAVDEELWFGAMREEGKIGAVYGSAQTDQRSNAFIFAAYTKANPAAETEAGKQQRNIWKFGSEKIQSGANIAALAVAFIVFPFASSGAAKIKSQNGQPELIQSFRSLIDHFVVHRSAEEWMGMADERGDLWSARGRGPQNGFELSGGACKGESAAIVQMVGLVH
jgi:hypothetical protein